MPKDTKSSGYNKAPACESRGFGHKKEGENFDTPSFSLEVPPQPQREKAIVNHVKVSFFCYEVLFQQPS